MSKEMIERLRKMELITCSEAANTIEELTDRCNYIMTEHGKLLKEVEGLRKDAARLDRLERQPGAQLHQPVHMPNTISEATSWLITDAFGDHLGEGKTLRDAIDAAMSSNP